MRGDEARAGLAGCDAYLTKPLDARLFHEVLHRFLRRGARVGGDRAQVSSGVEVQGDRHSQGRGVPLSGRGSARREEELTRDEEATS